VDDVFISYSRTDSEFVHALDDHLRSEKRTVWVDWEDIPPGSDWQQDIYEGIDDSESFIFVLSPKSLASVYCGRELERAQKGGKRIVPIALDGTTSDAAGAALAQLNWIWCRSEAEHQSAFEKVSSALETDLAWAKAHTRLLTRAVEWDAHDRDGSYLLRGRDLTSAEEALTANAAKSPTPTELQQAYVRASRKGAARRQQVVLGGVTVALVVAIVLGVLALLQRNKANDRAQVARSQALAAQSTEELAAAPAAALNHAVLAVETRATPEAETALRNAMIANPIAYVIPPARRDDGGLFGQLFFDHTGTRLTGITSNGTLRVWDAHSGTPVGRPVAHNTHVVVDRGRRLAWTIGRTIHVGATTNRLPRGTLVLALGSKDGHPLAVLAAHGFVSVQPAAGGRGVRLEARRGSIMSAVFSANGRRVLTEDVDYNHIDVWDSTTGRLVVKLPGGTSTPTISPDGREVTGPCCPEGLWSVAPRKRLAVLGNYDEIVYSPGGRLLVTVADDGTAHLYRARTGHPVGLLPGFGTIDPYSANSGVLVFSPDFLPGVAFDGHDHIAVANADGTVRVWKISSGKVISDLAVGWVDSLAFGPGGLLAAMTWDGSVVVARLPSTTAVTGDAPAGQTTFTPSLDGTGTRLVLPDGPGAVVADIGGSHQYGLPMPTNRRAEGMLDAWGISGDGRTVATSAGVKSATGDPRFRGWTGVWRVGSARSILRLPHTFGPIMLAGNGSLIAFDGKAWRTATGRRVRALDGIRLLSTDGRIALVRRGTRATIVRLGSPPGLEPLIGFGRLSPDDQIAGTFSPTDDRLVTTGDRGTVLWNVATGAQVARLGRAGEDVTSVTFGEGGRTALVVFGKRAAVFDASNGKPMARPVTGTFDAISPNGEFAAAAAEGGAIKITDVETGVMSTFPSDTTVPLASLAFASNSATLVATDPDGGVHLIRCPVCASSDALLAQAKETLGHLPRLRPPHKAAT
jgi:WD40 repeat protein